MAGLSSLLFETSVWLTIGVVVIGLIVLGLSLTRGDKNLRVAGLVVLGLGVLWTAATHFVVTDVEAVEQRTGELVQSYADADWTRFGQLIDPETQLDTLLIGQDITTRAEQVHNQMDHSSVTVSRSDAKRMADNKIEVTVEVTSQQNIALVETLTTGWAFLYTERNGQWQLDTITILPGRRIDPEAIRRQIGGGRR